MKALVYHGTEDVRVDTVPDPRIQSSSDCILKVTRSAICGSDLHLYGGYNPAMKEGDILGHEFMGEVVEIGSDVRSVRVGDRVLVPFNIADGTCWYCTHNMTALCSGSNSNNADLEKLQGYPAAGLYGYSHLYGGFAGGQAQYVRVIMADANVIPVPDTLSDERVLFLTDIFPTGYMAAENAHIAPGDTVAVWGAGPVGQFVVASALLFRAGKVIVIDRVAERLVMAAKQGAEVINYEAEDDVVGRIKDMTGGRGPDAVIDAVGLEAHAQGFEGVYDRVKQSLRLQTDRPSALREVIQAARPGSTVSIPGVYTGMVDSFPLGVAFGKGLSFKMGQTNVHAYVPRLLEMVAQGEIDPSFVITNRIGMDEIPEYYKKFRDKEDGCIKVVIDPQRG